MMKAFQLVRIPPMPPTSSKVPAQPPCQRRAAASAVAMLASPSAPGGMALATANDTAPYQSTARPTENTSRTPMRRAGRSTSSADCGSTSKPTSIAGTMMTTLRMPTRGVAKNGSAVATEPWMEAPPSSTTPDARIIAVTMVCTTDAVRMPT